MPRLTTRLLTLITVGLVASFAGPALAADLPVTPDARDAATSTGVYAVTTPSQVRVVVSPDASDAARQIGVYVTAEPTTTVTVRSPDATDAARGIQVGAQTAPVESTEPSNGFEWGDAFIGAAAMLGLMALAGGAVLLATHHGPRHGPLAH